MTALPALEAFSPLLESVHLHAAGSIVDDIAPFPEVDEGSLIYATLLRHRKSVVSLPGSILDPFPSTSTTDTSSLTDSTALPTSDPTVTVTATNTVVVTDPFSSTSMAGLPGSRLSLSTTGTSSNPQQTSTASFAFSDVPFMTACTNALIAWTYSGPDEPFNLLASTSITPHPEDEGGSAARIFDAPVALDIPAALQSFTWSPVNLTSGWYTLQASGPDFSVDSGQFWIENGTDTSCLGTVPSPSSSSSATSAPTSAPSVIATSASTSPTSSTSTLPIPVSDAVSTHSRTGAIAGGVIGGLVIIGAAIAAYIYFGLCRRTPSKSRRGSGRPGQLGKWGGLSSRDSGMEVGLPVANVPISGKPPPLVVGVGLPKRRATTESTGAILTPLSSTAHGHSLTPSRGASDEDVSSIGHEEKVVLSPGLGFFEGVPPSRRRSSTSGSSATTPISEPPSAHGAYGRNRARSPSQSHRALALAKLDGDSGLSSSVPPTHSTRTPPVARRSVDSMQLHTFDTPLMPMQSPLTQASPMNRTASGNGPRRAARKPVPTLTEADMVSPTSGPMISPNAASASASSASGSAADSRSPTASPYPMYGNNSGSGSTSTLRAPSVIPGRQHSREDLIAAGIGLPNLNHKSSFGDKPVHYIIPDMPPPPRSQ